MIYDREVFGLVSQCVAACNAQDWPEARRLLAELSPRMEARSEYCAIPGLFVDQLEQRGAPRDVLEAIRSWNVAAKHCTKLALRERNSSN